MLTAVCKSCGAIHNLEDECDGKAVKCKKCGGTLQVQAIAEPAAPRGQGPTQMSKEKQLFDALAETCFEMLVNRNPDLEKGALRVERVDGRKMIVAVTTGHNMGDSYSFTFEIKGPTKLPKV